MQRKRRSLLIFAKINRIKMKKYLFTFIISLFFLGNNVYSQITTVPAYPSDQDLITLTFDATGKIGRAHV